MLLVKTFYYRWFFVIWAILLVLGGVFTKLPPGQFGVTAALFWLVLPVCGFLLVWSGRALFRVWTAPVQFRPAEGAEIQKLPPPRSSWGASVLWLGFLGTFVTTLSLVPFSEHLKLISGLRTRTVKLPESPLVIEDRMPADIYLLPLRSFPPEAAAWQAATLRRETGLTIAALPPLDLPATPDPKRHQIAVETFEQGINNYLVTLRLPPPPRPHAPLVIALFEENAYTLQRDWNFVLYHPSNKISGVVCSYQLGQRLPLDDAAAQERFGLRLKKILLRAISFQAFGRPVDPDDSSLLRPMIRSTDDLDRCEPFLRQPLLEQKR